MESENVFDWAAAELSPPLFFCRCPVNIYRYTERERETIYNGTAMDIRVKTLLDTPLFLPHTRDGE